MNIPTTFTRAISTTGRTRAFYSLLGAAAIFTIGGALFTVLQTVRITATMNSIPSLVYLFMVIYLTLQLILAIGFTYALRALFPILMLHSLALLASALLVLPLLSHGEQTVPTLLAGIPFFLLTILAALGRSHLTPVRYGWALIAVYTLCLVATLYLNGMMLL